MEAQTLEFKGLKRRESTTFVYESAAPAIKPKKANKKNLEILPKEIKKHNISGKLLLSFFYIVCTGQTMPIMQQSIILSISKTSEKLQSKILVCTMHPTDRSLFSRKIIQMIMLEFIP